MLVGVDGFGGWVLCGLVVCLRSCCSLVLLGLVFIILIFGFILLVALVGLDFCVYLDLILVWGSFGGMCLL